MLVDAVIGEGNDVNPVTNNVDDAFVDNRLVRRLLAFDERKTDVLI
jgi:hypothetical protein